MNHRAITYCCRNVGPGFGWGGILFLVEREERVGQGFPAIFKEIAAVIDNSLDLKIIECAAAFQRGEEGGFDKEAALRVARNAAGMVARVLLLHGVMVRLAAVGAGDVRPAFTQKFGRPFVRLARILAKEFCLQVAEQGIHRVIIFQDAAEALIVLREIDGATGGGTGDGLVFGIEFRN